MDPWMPPEGRQREWVLERLRELIAQRGVEEFLTTPLVAPNPRHFPDPFVADEESLAALADRLLRYARLDDLRSRVYLFVNETGPEHMPTFPTARTTEFRQGGTAALYFGTEEGVCHFGVDAQSLGDPMAFVGSLCHEVAHAWRYRHGLARREDPQEEPLTDLTTCYLGFGILLANATYRFRTSGTQMGYSWNFSWSHSRAGYLTPGAICLLLAIHATLHYRGHFKDVRRWLELSQADSFDQAIETLDLHELVEALELPMPYRWPPELRAVPVG